MQDSNVPSAPLRAPDFSQEIRKAESTGDYDFVLETARESHKMFLNFRDAILSAQYTGKQSHAIALGLNFLDNMVSNSQAQIDGLKKAEKQTRDAMKAALKTKGETSMKIIDPEVPAEPQAPEVPSEPVAETPTGESNG